MLLIFIDRGNSKRKQVKYFVLIGKSFQFFIGCKDFELFLRNLSVDVKQVFRYIFLEFRGNVQVGSINLYVINIQEVIKIMKGMS